MKPIGRNCAPAVIVTVQRLVVAFALAGALGACATVETTEAGAVGVERQQTMSRLVSAEDINQGSAEAYAQVLAQAREKGALNRDPGQVARVRTIAQRIVPQTRHFRADAPGWKWEVNVISSNELNAWAMPGGKIAFYTGLIERLQLTDGEIAAIMGHEIAHALREHGRERASQAVNQSLALGVLGAVTGIGEGGVNLAQLALEVTLNLPNSRTQETEADRIGVELAARAGYDPHAAVTLWQKMGQAAQGAPPRWLSTHPPRAERLADLQAYADKVMPLYQSRR
jgi:predicted Zn-dependent protease